MTQTWQSQVTGRGVNVPTQQVGLFPYCRKFVHHFLAEEGRLTSVYNVNHTVNLVGQSGILPKPGAVWPDGSQRVELGCRKRIRAHECLLKSTTGLTGNVWCFLFAVFVLDLVTIFHMALVDVDQILYVQTSIGHFLQAHCVAQHQRQRLAALPGLDGVGAELKDNKQAEKNKLSSTGLFQGIVIFTKPIF